MIPKRLLIAKTPSENKVAPIILDFLTDDGKYGYLNAEERRMLTEDVYRDKTQTRMKEFVEQRRLGNLHGLEPCDDNNNNNGHNVITNEMPRKIHLKNVFIPNYRYN